MRTYIFKNIENESVTLAVNALSEKVATAVMANTVRDNTLWDLQYDFEMEDLTDDFIGGSDDAMDHIDEDVDLDDWDEDDDEFFDTDTGVLYREDLGDDGRGYN